MRKVIGYALDPDTYVCVDCYDGDPEEAYVEFLSGEETDSPRHCIQCSELIPFYMTEHGVEYIIEHLILHFVQGWGRAKILQMWVEHYGWDIRDYVAENPETAIEIMEAITQNPRFWWILDEIEEALRR